jgi:citrate lyase subunit beta/citryl-CoA lyase
MQTADLLRSDAVIFDLEDAVDPEEKIAARELLGTYLQVLDHPRFETIVRINAIDSPDFAVDLRMVNTVRPNQLMIPKATKAVIDDVANQTDLPLIALIETAEGLIDVEAICASGKVAAVAFGAEDFRLDMGITRQVDASELAYARARIAVACKAYRLDAIDTPWIDTYDDAGLHIDALRAKALGFTGKLCIHPSQIDTVHRVFSPSADDIQKARRIVGAWNDKQRQGIGVFRLDNKMIDKPVALQAMAVLEQAKRAGWRDPDDRS